MHKFALQSDVIKSYYKYIFIPILDYFISGIVLSKNDSLKVICNKVIKQSRNLM